MSHLGGNIAMFQLYNGQVEQQLHENKDCIQDHQTYHQNLKATSDNQEEETLGLTAQWWNFKDITTPTSDNILV